MFEIIYNMKISFLFSICKLKCFSGILADYLLKKVYTNNAENDINSCFSVVTINFDSMSIKYEEFYRAMHLHIKAINTI